MMATTSPAPITASSSQTLSSTAPPLTLSYLDTLPVLSSILSRLSPGSFSGSSQPTGITPQAISPSQPSSEAPLALKDLPSSTDGLKHGIQRARIQASQLPDVDRSIEEQEEEIRELEEKIRSQKDVLQKLRDVGAGLLREREDKMEL